MMKKVKKAKAVKEREVLFKAYLIRNQRTQKEIADELGVESSAIKRSIERGVFKTGRFAEWWKKNINNAESNSVAINETKEVVA